MPTSSAISTEPSGPIATPTDQQLEAFIKANANAFSTPEYRQLTFAAIGPDDVASQVQVPDAQLACVNGTSGWFTAAGTVILGRD